MKLYKFFIFFVPLLSLYGCGEQVAEVESKKDFIVSVIPIQTSSNNSYISKSAKIIWSSEIMLTSQTAWRVVQITTKIWQNISQNWRIAKLEDTNWWLMFWYQRSILAIDSAKNSYTVSKLNLEKQIEDSKLNLDKSSANYQSTLLDSDKQLEKLNRDIQNNDPNNTSWTLYIQMQKLQLELDKAKLDQQTKIKSDEQTIQNTILSSKNIYADLNNIYQDTYNLWEVILQPKSPALIDAWRWAKDLSTRSMAYNQRDIFSQQQSTLKSIWNDINSGNISKYLDSYKNIVSYTNNMIVSLKNLSSNSVSVTMTQSELDAYNGQISALQSRASGILWSITNQLAWAESFLWVYADNQDSLDKQIQSLEYQISLTKKQLDDGAYVTQNWLDRTKIWIDTNITNTKSMLDGATSNYDFANNTKTPNLETINNQLKSAQVALNQSQFEISKLDVKSPIAWIIADIYVDLWQDVSPGTPIAKIVSNFQEINIHLNKTEINYVNIWDYVTLVNSIWTWLWKIVATSPVADANWDYKVIISVEDDNFDIWSFVDVRIPLSQWGISISINNINILDNWYWSIILRDWSGFINQKVKLWNIFWDSVQILSDIPKNKLIVISDISNYDPDKMTIKIDQE